jgi:hypothetical protein
MIIIIIIIIVEERTLRTATRMKNMLVIAELDNNFMKGRTLQ